MSRLGAIIASFLFLAGCSTQVVSVYPVSIKDGEKTKQSYIGELKSDSSNGIFYSLPRTVFDIEIEIIQKTTKPQKCEGLDGNECTKLAGLEYFNIADDKIAKDDTTQYFIKNVTITPSFEPDPEQHYFVKLMDDFDNARELKLTLSELGVVSDATAKSTNKQYDYLVAGLTTAASIGGAAMGLAGRTQLSPLDQMIKDYNSFCMQTNKANQVFTLELFEAIKKEYETRIYKALEEYTGTISTKTETVKARYVPKPGVNDVTLFEYTPDGLAYQKTGITYFLTPFKQKKESSGKKYPNGKVVLHINPLEDAAKTIQGSMKTMLDELGLSPGKSDPPYGLAYRIPGRAEVIVEETTVNKPKEGVQGDESQNDPVPQVKEKKEVIIAQYGLVAFLPKEFNCRKSGVQVSYYPETGALKMVNVEITPLEGSDIKALGQGVQDVTGVGNTELANKVAHEQAKANLLEAKVKLREQQNRLNQLE